VTTTSTRAEGSYASYHVSLPLSKATIIAVEQAIAVYRQQVRSRWRSKTNHEAALIVLGHLRHDQRLADLAGGNDVSASTVRRWVLQVITVLAARTPRLDRILHRARRTGLEYVLLDATLIRSTRRHGAAGRRTYNGKHHTHGLLFSALVTPAGHLLWLSKARPGRTHDAAAARGDHLPSQLATADLAAVADLAYTGLAKQHNHDPDQPIIITGRRPHPARPLTAAETTTNQIITAERAANEHPFGYLKNWRILTRLRMHHRNATKLLRALMILTQIENPR
jgi:DDE superfamily endonuclease